MAIRFSGRQGLKRWQATVTQKDEPLRFVGESYVLQGESGSHDALTAHQIGVPLREVDEHMLVAGPGDSTPVVAPLRGFGDVFGGIPSPLDMAAPTNLFQFRLPLNTGTAGIGTHVASIVTGVNQCFKHHAISLGSMGDGKLAYQLIALVDTDVELVAELILAVVFGLFGVHIFLSPFGVCSAKQQSALLDLSAF